MPQQHLHHPKIRPVIEQMGGERMPERMRRKVLGDSAANRIMPDSIPEGLPGHGGATITRKQGITGFASQQLAPGLPHVL